MPYRTNDWLVPTIPNSKPLRSVFYTNCCNKCAKKDKRFRSVDQIVGERVKAGISGRTETIAFFDVAIKECDYSDDFKRRLIAELNAAQRKSK